MKYRFLKARGSIPPWERDAILYIAPVSEKGDRYQVLTPGDLDKGKEYTLLRQSLTLKTYEGFSDLEADRVREALIQDFRFRADKFASRMRTFFSIGIVAAVLGLINAFVPDPLPALDEIVLIAGGGLVAFLSSLALRKHLVPFRNCINGIIESISTIPLVTDPLLTTLHRAIRSRALPGMEEKGETGADDIERESAWLVTHLNLTGLLQSEEMDTAAFRRVMNVLASSFKAKSLLHPVRRRSPRLHRSLSRLGLDENAVAVYEELFSRARDIFAERGERFP